MDIKKKRKAVEDQIIHEITLAAGGDPRNAELYKDKFEKMSDDEFVEFIEQLRKKEIWLCMNIYPDALPVLATQHLALARKLGARYRQKLVYPARGPIPSRKSPLKFPVHPVFVRRQRQIGTMKNSTAKTTPTVNLYSGQAAGDAAAGRLSGPEVGAHASNGYDEMLSELFTVRGGDIGAYRAFTAEFLRTGDASLQSISQASTGPESVRTMHQLLLGMHILSNLADQMPDP